MVNDEPSENAELFNKEAAGNITLALRRYNELDRRQQENGKLSAEEKGTRDALLNTIFAQRQLVLVTPGPQDADIQAQLVSPEKKDKVHPVGTPDDLRSFRLGGENSNKQAYALVVPGEDGVTRQVLAVVYTNWSAQGSSGLPGKVNEILKEPSHALIEPPDTVIFYSISSFMPRAGQTLIEDLHEKITREAGGRPVTMSTLSPLRSFKSWLTGVEGNRIDPDGLDDSELTDLALDCLLANRDPVEKFHLSNGAYVGAIKLRANENGSADARDGFGVMVNYVYPADPASLERNKAAYRQGIIPLHPGLYQSLGPGQEIKAVPVSAAGRAVNNNDPPEIRPS